jgi:hypothetical protein
LTHFPTLAEVENSITKFGQAGFPRFSPEDNVEEFVSKITDILTTELNVLPNVTQIEKVNKFGFKLYRVRELSSFSNRNLISEYSYTPIALTKIINRCNFPGHPVFYCSSQPMTALCEVVKNDNFEKKRYLISRWSTKNAIDIMLLESFTHGNLPKESILNTLKYGIQNRIPEIFEHQLTKDQENGLKLYLEFLSDSFIRDNDYSVSASLSHRRFYARPIKNNPRTDVLLYPSVQTRYMGINMAVQPSFVDKFLFPDRFFEVEINTLNKEIGEINVSFSRYGEADKDKVNWTNITPSDTVYRNFIKDDFNFTDELIFIKSND